MIKSKKKKAYFDKDRYRKQKTPSSIWDFLVNGACAVQESNLSCLGLKTLVFVIKSSVYNHRIEIRLNSPYILLFAISR